MTDQYTFGDPRSRYSRISPPVQQQKEPGIQSAMTPVPDLGEKTYRGTGRLTGRRVLITGADSGIGAAVAIAFAREGADAVNNFSEGLSQQLIESSIGVNVMAPRPTWTLNVNGGMPTP